jgi:PAS domain S-box-containing protein
MSEENSDNPREDSAVREHLNLPSLGVICIDEEGFLLDVNEEALELLGYTDPDAVKSRAVYEFIVCEDCERLKQKIKHTMETNKTSSTILYIKYPDDELMKIEINLTPWLNDTGKSRTIGLLRSIKRIPAHERRKTASLNKALESFKTIVGPGTDSVQADDEEPGELFHQNIWMFGIDAKGLCKTWNDYCEQYFGYSKEEVVNKKTLFDLLDPAQTGGTTVVLKSALSSEKMFRADIKFAPRPGLTKPRQGHVNIIKCMEFSGKDTGYICMFYPTEEEDDEALPTLVKSPEKDISIDDPPVAEAYPYAYKATPSVDTPPPATPPPPANPFDNAPTPGFGTDNSYSDYNDFAIVSQNGDIRYVSGHFAKQLGFQSADELKEHNWFELMTEKPARELFTADCGVMNAGTRIPYKTKEGEVMETDLQVIPMHDKNGNMTEALWLLNPDNGLGEPDLGPERRRPGGPPTGPPTGPPSPGEMAEEYENALLQLNQDLIALNLIADVIEQYNDFHEMISAVMDTLIGVVSVEYCGLYLVRDDRLRLEYSIGLPAGRGDLTLSNTTDTDKLTGLTESTFKGSIKDIVKSSITVPIASHGRNLGFISLASSNDTEFTNMDMDLINTVAHQVAGAILKQEFYYDYSNLKREYNEVYEESPDIYIKVDSNGLVRACNRTSFNVLGCSQKEITGRELTAVLQPKLGEAYDSFEKWFTGLLSTKKASNIDLKMELENAELRYYNVIAKETGASIPGEETGLRLVFRDITAHQKDKSFLRSAGEIMEQIFNATNNLIIYIDMNKTIIECNKNVTEVLGYDRKELRGQFMNVLYANDLLQERYFSRMDEVYSGADEIRLEQVVRRKDGSMFVAMVTACSVRNDSGETTGMALHLTDITTRKREEKELVEAKKESTLYINVLSHDLTNYNQCSLSYLDLLDNTKLEPEQKNYINIIKEQLESSIRLGQNVRKLSEIKSKQAPLVTIDLNRVLRETAYSLMERSFRFGSMGDLDLKFEYPDGLYGVLADNLIEELFSNIFWNAVEHNTHDKKMLEIKITRPADNPDKYWQVEIHDNAFGIPDDQKNIIFNPELCFQNGNNSNGIGLSIINALVERYGGKLWVENRVPGDHTQGSVFKLLLRKAKLPLEKAMYGTGARV